MVRYAALALVVAACASRNDLTLLDLEVARFKARNEGIRLEDLEARYARQKEKADRLSAELIALGAERERLYAEYDVLKGALAKSTRARDEAARDRAACGKELASLRAETTKLRAALDAERGAIEKLRAELDEAEAKARALRAKRDGAKDSPQ